MEIDDADCSADLEQWNNVRAFYSYSGNPETPLLILTLALEISTYQSSEDLPEVPNPPAITDLPVWQQNAINDKQKLAGISGQLHRTYDEMTNPGILGPVVSIFLTNTLLKAEKKLFSLKDAQAIRDFVDNCLDYLTNRAAGQGDGPPPGCQLTLPFSPNDVSAADLVKLSITISFETKKSSESEIETASTGSPVTKATIREIECNIEDLIVSPQDTSIFADDFERLLFNEDWQLRIGKSVPAPGLLGERQTPTLWAIRMGRKPGVGYNYDIQNQASFYAPQPIARTLETAIIPISLYSTGNPFPADKTLMTFTNIDQNVWVNTVLTVIDTFLSNQTIQSDLLLTGEFETQDYLSKIHRHKKTIAAALTKTLIPIYASDARDEVSLTAAREVFYSAVLNRLSNAFTTTAVTVLNVSNVSVDDTPHPDCSLPPRFYGQIRNAAQSSKIKKDESEADGEEENYFPNGGKIRHFKSQDGKSGGWRLPFLFSMYLAGKQNDVSLPLAFALTHLESNIIEAADGGHSSWIKFVTAPLVTPVGNDRLKFPIILRELPAPPISVKQTAEPSAVPGNDGTSTLTPSELAFLNYSLTYDCQNSAQDSVKISISLDRQNDFGLAEKESHPLFAPLAQFVMTFQDILSDLEKSLGNISNLSAPTNPNFVNAITALKAFEQVVGTVADGFTEWGNATPEIKLEAKPVNTNFCFDLVLKPGADGKAQIDVIDNRLTEADPPSPPTIIVIEPYTPVTIAEKPDYSYASYNYIPPLPPPAADTGKTNNSPAYLSYKDALGISQRTIILKGLNVFTAQNAFGQIQVIRNAAPTRPGESTTINNSFKFISTTGKADGPFFPSLRFADIDLGQLPVSSRKLADYLDNFFDSLLQEASGLSLRLKMEVFFSFEIAPDSLRTILPITMLPPLVITPRNGAHLPFIAPLVETIINWTRLNNPKIDASSEYNLRLEIFGEESALQAAQLPLLAIDNLFIKTEKITFG